MSLAIICAKAVLPVPGVPVIRILMPFGACMMMFVMLN